MSAKSTIGCWRYAKAEESIFGSKADLGVKASARRLGGAWVFDRTVCSQIVLDPLAAVAV
jgi:hypothetical protein